MKKKIFSSIFIILLIVGTLWVILSGIGISDLKHLFLNTNKYFLLIALLCMIGYWLMDSFVTISISKMINVKMSIMKSLKFTMIGQYYSAITPFSSGGQPAQVYAMVGDSIPAGTATSILIDKFIIYQVVVTLYSIIMFCLRIGFVFSHIQTALPFVIVGLILNFVAIVSILGLFLNSSLLRRVIHFFIHVACKLKIITDIEKYRAKSEIYIKEYMEGISKIKKSWRKAFNVSVMTIIQLTLYFSITYFVYRALGFNEAAFIDIISIQSLLYMAVSFIPTPGTSGAAEGGFFIIFKVFFNTSVLTYAVLLWRIISYYLNLIVCGIVTFINYMYRRRAKLAVKI